MLDNSFGDLPHRQAKIHRGLLDPAEGVRLGEPELLLEDALGPVDGLRVASDSERSATSRSRTVISAKRLTAISMAGTRSLRENGLTR